MFSKNDYVIYGSMSVCKILDIVEEENIYIGRKSYYVIQPVYSDKNTIIKVPTDNKKVLMRHLLSEKEVLSIIKSIPNLDVLKIENDRQRSEHFKSVIKNNECEELAQLVKSIALIEQEKLSIGKKISKTDEDFKKTAEKLIDEEFATVLNIPVQDVPSFILNNIPQ
ncbi:CarD family transcriptional regulator [Terrisporobacter glycolicus]|uniref:CarD-like/TRCF RNAP-interacting domain-containing protein n=1 Tax=Terrisporobacter glycolicus ATCC 14880 = DSM 1288 TaxID=1121315 RepID=A0ABZ2ET92_9FIRM|nr:CarD family transcriptional regulator [Terrisporobacter glycolicus]